MSRNFTNILQPWSATRKNFVAAAVVMLVTLMPQSFGSMNLPEAHFALRAAEAASTNMGVPQVAVAKSPPAKPASERVVKKVSTTIKKVMRGKASWYGPGFHGKKTASGETFDQKKLTAAHKTLPLGSIAKVTNLENGNSVEVEITDRGPYVGQRIIDLSYAAADRLGFIESGTAPVRIELLAGETG